MQEQEDEVPISQLRPRFKIETELGGDEIADRLRTALQRADRSCIGEVSSRYATLMIQAEDQHYWSPQLSLTIEESDDGTVVRGLYGPRPSVWTMFVFFYALIGFAIVVISAIGMIMLSLGKSAIFLWIVPFLLLVFLSLYYVAYLGKKKGYAQGEILHRFFADATGLEH